MPLDMIAAKRPRLAAALCVGLGVQAVGLGVQEIMRARDSAG